MKITKQQLKQIIKEELQLLSEEEYDRYRDYELAKYGYRGKGDYERRQGAARRRTFTYKPPEKPRDARYGYHGALEPGRRMEIDNEIKKLEVQYDRTDNEEEKEMTNLPNFLRN